MLINRRENAKEIRAHLDKILKMPVPKAKLIEFGLDGPEFESLTFGEVVAIKLVENGCMGDNTAIRELFDRLYGKPVQTNENINANMSIYDWAKMIADQAKAEGWQIEAPAPVKKLPEPKTERLPPRVYPVTAQPTTATAPEDLLEELP